MNNTTVCALCKHCPVNTNNETNYIEINDKTYILCDRVYSKGISNTNIPDMWEPFEKRNCRMFSPLSIRKQIEIMSSRDEKFIVIKLFGKLYKIFALSLSGDGKSRVL